MFTLGLVNPRWLFIWFLGGFPYVCRLGPSTDLTAMDEIPLA